MKKQITSYFLSLLMVVSLVGVLPVLTASADISGDYAYEALGDGTVKIIQYNGNAENLSIPATIKGKKVTSIGINAFHSNYDLKAVKIPNNVKTLQPAAFANCSNLSSVTLPSTLEQIQDDVFKSCYSLTSVNIPAKTTHLGSLAFNDCKKLTAINVNSANTAYSSIDGIVYNKAGTTLIMAPAGKPTVKIPSGVKAVADDAFLGSYLKSVTFPTTVTSIGLYSFSGCPNLTSVILPNVTTIGSFAFEGCSNLSSVTIGSGVRTIDTGAFFNCPSLKSVLIPKTVKTIYPQAFGFGSHYVNEDIEEYKIAGFVIYCYSGSAAVTYATKHGVKYKLILPKVTGFKVLGTSTNKVKLTCTKQSGAKGYIFYQYNASTKKWARIAKTTSNTYMVSNLRVGTTYKFGVKAYTTSGNTEISSFYYPTVTTSTKPAAVNFSVKAGSKKATLSWKNAAGVYGTKIYYKASKNANWTGLATTSGTSYTKTGLTSGKTYYFAVKAYRNVMGTIYNGPVTTKSVTVK